MCSGTDGEVCLSTRSEPVVRLLSLVESFSDEEPDSWIPQPFVALILVMTVVLVAVHHQHMLCAFLSASSRHFVLSTTSGLQLGSTMQLRGGCCFGLLGNDIRSPAVPGATI